MSATPARRPQPVDPVSSENQLPGRQTESEPVRATTSQKKRKKNQVRSNGPWWLMADRGPGRRESARALLRWRARAKRAERKRAKARARKGRERGEEKDGPRFSCPSPSFSSPFFPASFLPPNRASRSGMRAGANGRAHARARARTRSARLRNARFRAINSRVFSAPVRRQSHTGAAAHDPAHPEDQAQVVADVHRP